MNIITRTGMVSNRAADFKGPSADSTEAPRAARAAASVVASTANCDKLTRLEQLLRICPFRTSGTKIPRA